MPTPSDRISESSMTDLWNVWFTELHRRRVGLTIKIKQLLYTAKSPYQRIDVLDTYEFGRMLVLYGSIMVTEKDEFVYHEMLAHVPLFAHPKPRKRVLIIGGGDGGTLREVMRHKQRARHDGRDRRDGRADVAEVPAHHRHRVQEPARPGPLRGRRALARPLQGEVRRHPGRRLRSRRPRRGAVPEALPQERGALPGPRRDLRHPVGVAVLPPEDGEAGIQRNLQEIFQVVRPYTAKIPTYPSGFWSFTLCSDTPDPVAHFKESRVKKPPASSSSTTTPPSTGRASPCRPSCWKTARTSACEAATGAR